MPTEMLAEFGNTRAWEVRMRAIGHGRSNEISTAEALAIAAGATPLTAVLSDPHDPNGRKPGDRVDVMPDDYGKVKVSGEIVALSSQHIAIRGTTRAPARSWYTFRAPDSLCLRPSAPFPKFVIRCGALRHELRKQKGH